MSMDFRGDPSSALLEVLDPEQNSTFSDHFIEIPVDLSHVLFLVTANVAYNIPGPLRDRMEIINLPGYTEAEKLEIARRYLVPKQMKENGLQKGQLKISDKELKTIIEKYTREAVSAVWNEKLPGSAARRPGRSPAAKKRALPFLLDIKAVFRDSPLQSQCLRESGSPGYGPGPGLDGGRRRGAPY